MKYLLLALLVVLPILAACGDDDDDGGDSDGGATSTETTSASDGTSGEDETTTPDDGEEPTGDATSVPTAASSICPENPDPATDEQVQIDTPESGDSSETPLRVEGMIAAFEAQFNISLVNSDGAFLVKDMPAMSSEGQTLAPFAVDVPFVVSDETDACLQVYDLSAEDGVTRVDIFQMPVTLLP